MLWGGREKKDALQSGEDEDCSKSPYLQTGGGEKGEKEEIHTLILNLCCISFHKIMPNHSPAVTFIENPSPR